MIKFRFFPFLGVIGLSACSTLTTPLTVTIPQEVTHEAAVPQKAVPKAEIAKQPPVVKVASEAEHRALLEADATFARLAEENGAAQAYYEFMMPEGTCMLAGEFPIKGREAIQVYLSANSQGLLVRRPREAEVADSGELGYTWGSYELRTNGEQGQPRIKYGKYLTVWKKLPNESWRVLCDATTSSPPPPDRR